MSGPSMHRAMCKKVACLECDSLETRTVEGDTFTARFTTFIADRFIEDFQRRLFYDSTIQPGRQVTAAWDFDQLVKEMAADD